MDRQPWSQSIHEQQALGEALKSTLEGMINAAQHSKIFGDQQVSTGSPRVFRVSNFLSTLDGDSLRSKLRAYTDLASQSCLICPMLMEKFK
jgi:hypothetical protein